MPSEKRGNESIGWGVRIEGRTLWSRNAVKGVRLRGERLKHDGRQEWRQWSLRSSKLGAALMRTQLNPSRMLPEPGSTAVYLGAGHGTTVSHLHDHLCGSGNHQGGRLIAVDMSPRCVRDLITLAAVRPGMVPVCADVRQTLQWVPMVGRRVDWLFQDVSQAGQAEMLIESAKKVLFPGGTAILSLKAASERRLNGGLDARYDATASTLEEAGFNIGERIDLAGLEDEHMAFVMTAPGEWS